MMRVVVWSEGEEGEAEGDEVSVLGRRKSSGLEDTEDSPSPVSEGSNFVSEIASNGTEIVCAE